MIEFNQFGSGPRKLIGLHGWFGDETTFEPLEQSLDPAQVHAIWLAHRGYGKSKDIVGDYTMREMAADALEVVDSLGWDTFAVIGHSMGGKAAQLLAARAPERVDKLIAVAAAPANPVPFDEQTRALFDSVAHDADSRRNVVDHSTGNRLARSWVDALVRDSIARTTPVAQAAYLKSWADDDLVPDVEGCQVEALILAGEHDPVISPAVCKFVFDGRFVNARIETIANSGHYPADEAPLATGAAVAGFLQN
ncbi:hypothetical protein XU06_30280 (plasmid) [Rhodococcus erythropolis]|uniref:alpha/beta fold hydrolase n=1 Tax=Rhodococcus erythropolis TaxID=1833 RepID=UPI00061B8224|nr:alpha/beta hydrolase [Rhodococcus erythropolis]AKE01218.1 hypothetical protein XU06_30280 [Rhodococcus erythropolis]